MKKFFSICLTLTALLLRSFPCSGNVLKVIDANDGDAIAGAVVISGKGLIIGQTDDNGSISVNAPADLPLTFNCLGYQQAIITENTDTVRLSIAGIDLPEVTVALDRPVRGVICFAREYCSSATGTDTMQLYSEYMFEAFLADDKVKGYKKSDSNLKMRNVRRYARFSSASGLDSIAVPGRFDDVTLLSFITLSSIPTKPIAEPEAFREGATAGIVEGKYGPATFYRKNADMFSVRSDVLADYKDHHWEPNFFKLLGMTTDFRTFDITYAFAANESGKYDITDLICQSETLHFLFKGKILKKIFHSSDPIDVDCLIEIYPVEIVNYTIDSYKNRKKNKDSIPFTKPESVQPLSPALAELITRIDTAFPDRNESY